MDAALRKRAGLTGNQLKLIALAAMTADHVGLVLLPSWQLLRYIGRIAMPVFAWMIAEGCRHTRSRGRYFWSIALLGSLCQTVAWLVTGTLYQNILITFTLSVLLIFLLDAAESRIWCRWLLPIALAAVFFLTAVLPEWFPGQDFAIDYGFFGVLLPVLFYRGENKWQQILLGALDLAALSLLREPAQWLCLLSLPLLALYNGQRGRIKMKYLFYIYYPAHLAAIYLLEFLLRLTF